MSFEMRPRTEPGARLLAAIRDVAPLLSERAEEADRNNQICEPLEPPSPLIDEQNGGKTCNRSTEKSPG